MPEFVSSARASSVANIGPASPFCFIVKTPNFGIAEAGIRNRVICRRRSVKRPHFWQTVFLHSAASALMLAAIVTHTNEDWSPNNISPSVIVVGWKMKGIVKLDNIDWPIESTIMRKPPQKQLWLAFNDDRGSPNSYSHQYRSGGDQPFRFASQATQGFR